MNTVDHDNRLAFVLVEGEFKAVHEAQHLGKILEGQQGSHPGLGCPPWDSC
jgi:hypothetical protein